MRSSALGLILLAVVAVGCGPAAPASNATAPASGSAGQGPPGSTGTEQTVYQNATGAVADLSQVFASVQQASQLQLMANATPSGASGADVESISIVGQDKGGLLKSLDASGKQTLGNALLSAAAEAWPNAAISLLVSDPSGGGGTIVGDHPKGGQNTVIAS